jgi:hypothetical protein
VVRTPDIDEYLRRVLQIIDRDRVEARSEFLKEKVFDKQQENLAKPEQKRRRPERPARPLRRASRHYKQTTNKGKSKPRAGYCITPQSLQHHPADADEPAGTAEPAQ